MLERGITSTFSLDDIDPMRSSTKSAQRSISLKNILGPLDGTPKSPISEPAVTSLVLTPTPDPPDATKVLADTSRVDSLPPPPIPVEVEVARIVPQAPEKSHLPPAKTQRPTTTPPEAPRTPPTSKPKAKKSPTPKMAPPPPTPETYTSTFSLDDIDPMRSSTKSAQRSISLKHILGALDDTPKSPISEPAVTPDPPDATKIFGDTSRVDSLPPPPPPPPPIPVSPIQAGVEVGLVPKSPAKTQRPLTEPKPKKSLPETYTRKPKPAVPSQAVRSKSPAAKAVARRGSTTQPDVPKIESSTLDPAPFDALDQSLDETPVNPVLPEVKEPPGPVMPKPPEIEFRVTSDDQEVPPSPTFAVPPAVMVTDTMRIVDPPYDTSRSTTPAPAGPHASLPKEEGAKSHFSMTDTGRQPVNDDQHPPSVVVGHQERSYTPPINVPTQVAPLPTGFIPTTHVVRSQERSYTPPRSTDPSLASLRIQSLWRGATVRTVVRRLRWRIPLCVPPEGLASRTPRASFCRRGWDILTCGTSLGVGDKVKHQQGLVVTIREALGTCPSLSLPAYWAYVAATAIARGVAAYFVPLFLVLVLRVLTTPSANASPTASVVVAWWQLVALACWVAHVVPALLRPVSVCAVAMRTFETYRPLMVTLQADQYERSMRAADDLLFAVVPWAVTCAILMIAATATVFAHSWVMGLLCCGFAVVSVAIEVGPPTPHAVTVGMLGAFAAACLGAAVDIAQPHAAVTACLYCAAAAWCCHDLRTSVHTWRRGRGSFSFLCALLRGYTPLEMAATPPRPPTPSRRRVLSIVVACGLMGYAAFVGSESLGYLCADTVLHCSYRDGTPPANVVWNPSATFSIENGCSPTTESVVARCLSDRRGGSLAAVWFETTSGIRNGMSVDGGNGTVNRWTTPVGCAIPGTAN